MRKRTSYSLLIMLALIAGLVVAVVLRKSAPPEVARLLPESDAIVYVNFKPLRVATHFDRTPVERSADFQRFMDATGIVLERDLDEAAFALHRMPNPAGPNGPVAYSEVFEGHFDAARLNGYLGTVASGRESYLGHEIFTIPIHDPGTNGTRSLRVAQLGYDTVAASNMPTPEQIHSILDRYRAAASPFAGSSLLERRYREVPAFSSAWAIGHIGLPFTEDGNITVLGLTLPLPQDTTFVASLRYTTALHLRIEQIAATADDAARSAVALETLVNVLKSVQAAEPRTDADAALREMTETIRIEQHNNLALVTATIPVTLLREFTSTASREASPGMP